MQHLADTWKQRLERCIVQEPLIDTGTSLEALHRMALRPAPRAVVVGIGLCTRTQLGTGLPLDLLGMLLPAERIRRVVGASSLVVLVADEHALDNGLDFYRVRERAHSTVATLIQIQQALALPHMRVVRASSFHHTEGYRAILDDVARRAPDLEHRYVAKQVADTEYLHRACRSILKVGWVIGRGRTARRCDEVVFDERVRECFGDRIGYVYCKAGRTLDDRKRKAIPYVVLDPAARICLRPDENVFRKLKRAQSNTSPDTINGYRNHLRALAYSFSKHVQPLAGPLEHRVQAIISRIVSVPRRATATAPLAQRSLPRSAAWSRSRSLPRSMTSAQENTRATGS